jgi:hypothetical protein
VVGRTTSRSCLRSTRQTYARSSPANGCFRRCSGSASFAPRRRGPSSAAGSRRLRGATSRRAEPLRADEPNRSMAVVNSCEPPLAALSPKPPSRLVPRVQPARLAWVPSATVVRGETRAPSPAPHAPRFSRGKCDKAPATSAARALLSFRGRGSRWRTLGSREWTTETARFGELVSRPIGENGAMPAGWRFACANGPVSAKADSGHRSVLRET